MILDPFQISLIVLISLIGLSIYWFRTKRAEKLPLTFSNFFLGGRKVGPSLTTHGTLGLCGAFANAVWYYTFLGFNYGLFGFLLQLFWSLSIALLGYFIVYYLKASHDLTIHGFIGKYFGKKTMIIAAIATSIGYILNCGFELYFSSRIISFSLGFDSPLLILTIACLLAGFCASYCINGGYSANVQTDKLQNYIAIFALIIFVSLLIFSISKTPETTNAISKNPGYFLFKLPEWHFIVGIIIFTFFFNFVDMANWQMIGANSELEESEIKKLKSSFYISGALQMIFPALLGSIIGVCLKYIDTSLTDDQFFPTAFSFITSGMGYYIIIITIGLLIFGFLSATLSSVDSYMIASIQTLSNDLFGFKRYKRIQTTKGENEKLKEEKKYLIAVIRWIPIFAISSVLVFAGLFQIIPEYVFSFQFIMYGSALALFPSLIYAFYSKYSKNQDGNLSYKNSSFHSIFWGVIGTVFTFLICALMLNEESSFRNAILNLLPLVALVISSAIFFFPIIISRIKIKQHE